jgi:type II secretory ATPase GspE/PulE/Tfp pilus assembly ATPase PilB-like protein
MASPVGPASTVRSDRHNATTRLLTRSPRSMIPLPDAALSPFLGNSLPFLGNSLPIFGTSLPIFGTLAQAADGAATVGGDAFVSWWKIALLLLMLVIWMRVLQWIDKDAEPARLPRDVINSVEWALLVVALVIVVVLPAFPMVLGAMVVLLLVGIGGYLAWRNTTVGLDDIPDQIKAFFKDLVTPKKKKGRKEKEKEETVAVGNVTLLDKTGLKVVPDSDDEQATLGYQTAHQMLVLPLERHAERVQIIQIASRPATAEQPAQARYGTKMSVDGVDHAGTAFEATAALAALGYLKSLAGLDAAETRKVQSGKLKAKTSEGSHDLTLVTRGTRQGETATIEVDEGNRYTSRATALGMTQRQRDTVSGIIDDREGGLIIVAAPPGNGLHSMGYGLVMEHDAFTQHIITAEREILRELEGVNQNVVGEDPNKHAEQYGWIADQQPEVVLAERPAGKGAAREILRHTSEEGRYAYVQLRADDVSSAVSSWIKLVGDGKSALKPLRLVIAGRVLRTLCDACKVPYAPGDQALAKMGVPKGKVRELYKARTEPMIDQRGNEVTCPFCGGLGYNGRTGAFEMLPVDETVRLKLLKDPSPATVRNLLRDAKFSTLNEAAVRQVIAGKTDLAEVRRVMSGESPRPAVKKKQPSSA